MKYVRLGLVCLLFVCAMPAFAAPPASCGTLNAGLQIVSGVVTSGSNYQDALKMAIWYPTDSETGSYVYSGYGWDMRGQVALEARPTRCAQFPLIIFSHGWGGCGVQTVFLTEQLARLGYIVAAPDHNDHQCAVDGTNQSWLGTWDAFPFTIFGNPTSWTDQTALYRNNDINAVMDYMLNSWSGRSAVDADKIVVAGHSFGGYTAFAKIGGWKSWLDRRFKGALLYSPFVQSFQYETPQTISDPIVPQLFMTGGSEDGGIQPWVKGPQPCGLGSKNCGAPGAYEQSGGLKFYGELAGTGSDANHYAFTDLICLYQEQLTTQGCIANVPNAKLIVDYTQDFLEHTLFGQTPQLLWTSGSGWATWWQAAAVPSGSFALGQGGAPSQVVTLFGERLTTDTASADPAPVMPTSLAQTTVEFTDGQGATRPGNLYYVSPTQVNVVVPQGTAVGQSTISVKVNRNQMSSGPLTIQAVAPALYTFPGNVLVGWAQASGKIMPLWSSSGARAIDVSQGNTYLICLGTGLRGQTTSIAASIGKTQFDGNREPRPALAAYITVMGLDQVNIGPLPASLQGAGVVDVIVTVDGLPSNTVQVTIQ